jgi:two-component system LytT family response regulator
MPTSNESLPCCPLCGTHVKVDEKLDFKVDLTLLIKENKKFVRIDAREIEVIEGMRDYLKIYAQDRIIITHMTMCKIEQLLDNRSFWRINRSFIVRKSFITSVTYNAVEMTNKMLIPVGINYKEFIKSIIETGYFE